MLHTIVFHSSLFSVKEEGKKDSMMNGKADDDDDDVVPLDR